MKKRTVEKDVSILSVFLEVGIFCIFLVLVFRFLLIPGGVNGSSMEPTLSDGARVLCRGSIFGQPQVGDIVIVDDVLGKGSHIIKRVIAVGGDTIDIRDGQVFRNEELLDEPYAKTPTEIIFGTEYPMVVPEDSYFVMGDNREVSIDSRDPDVGTVAKKKIRGVYLLTILK